LIAYYARGNQDFLLPDVPKGVTFRRRWKMTIIRPVTREDADSWLKLRCALWSEGSEAEHRDEIERFFRGKIDEPQEVIVAVGESGEIIGFVELSVRPYAEGCRYLGVAYLEGWYVVPEERGKGIGRNMIKAAEDWGRAKGCSEFASDAYPDDEASRLAHRAVGFDEVGLIRCFIKKLGS